MTSRQQGLRFAAAVMVIGLGACQGTGVALNGSPTGVPIKVESIDGPPASLKTAFASELATAATSRQVELVGTGTQARFRVRGYLSSETTTEGEPALAFVWDVYDDSKRRTRRITGSSPIRVAAGKPWSGLDREALAKLAAQSMDEIAMFLSESNAGG